MKTGQINCLPRPLPRIENFWIRHCLRLPDFICPLASLEIDLYIIHVEVVSGTLTHHPFFVIGSLYSITSGYNEYSSRKLLVSGSPTYETPAEKVFVPLDLLFNRSPFYATKCGLLPVNLDTYLLCVPSMCFVQKYWPDLWCILRRKTFHVFFM